MLFKRDNAVCNQYNDTIFTDLITKAEKLVKEIKHYYRDMSNALSISLTTTFIPDLAHENLYIIMKQFQDFILNLPLKHEKEAKIFFASSYRKSVDILSNHDVYIWLAAYREANFNYLLQIFYEPTHQNYKSYGPYVPLQHFMTQIDYAYLSSFYAVCCLITDCDNFDLTIVYVIV